MRIMELIDLHPNKLGGFERYCIGFSKYLMERGHTHILVFSGEPCAEVADSLARCGVNWYVRDLRSLGIKEAMYVGKLARAHNVDVIHVHFYPIYSALSLLCRIRRCALYATYHISGPINNARWGVWTLKRVRSRIAGCGLKRVFCVSRYNRERFLNDYAEKPSKVSVLYNGLEISDFPARMPAVGGSTFTAKFRLICVAALIEEKGVEDLLAAISALVGQIRDLEVQIVGEGPMRPSLQRMTEELGIDRYVQFLGLRSDVPYLLSQADAAVVPSRWAEAFGLTVIEGMAATLPVIATNVGGIPEIIENGVCGLLVAPYAPEELARSILRLYRNPELRRRLGEAAVERVRSKFDIEACFSEQLRYYEKGAALTG